MMPRFNCVCLASRMTLRRQQPTLPLLSIASFVRLCCAHMAFFAARFAGNSTTVRTAWKMKGHIIRLKPTTADDGASGTQW